MTFIEAALSLLSKSRRALTAEQLATKAVDEELLNKPGNNPTRSMKAALGRELKKGDDARVTQSGEDKWKLAASEKKAATKKKTTRKKKAAAEKQFTAETGDATDTKKRTATKKKAATKKKTTKKKSTTAKKAAEAPAADETPASETARPKKKRTTKQRGEKAPEPAETAQVEPEAPAVQAAPAAEHTAAQGAGKKTRRRRRKSRKERAAAQAAESTAESTTEAPVDANVDPVASQAVAEIIAPQEAPRRAAAPVTPEDEELAAIYGDELSGTEPGAAYAEYRDERTDDEDRPMSPELVANRKDRQKRERRERRKRQKTESRQRPERPQKADADQPAARPDESRAESRADKPTRTEPAQKSDAGADVATCYQPGNTLGAQAAAVLSNLDKTQSLRGKQLAQLMSKRGLIGGAPEKTWRHLEAALLHDEASHRAHGLRARVIHRGRGTFEAGDTVSDSGLAASEAALATAVADAVTATHEALAERLGKLDQGALERVVNILLVRHGFADIQWIKRTKHASYALANAPDGVGQQLISVCHGDQPVERGGIGELRVGVQAKKLASGLLLSPSGLSARAQNELRRHGASLSLLVGDRLVAALIDAGIGVTRAHISVPLLDERWLGDVLGE